ncbi:MAG: Mth938-like domain-containing protein [Woeseiaceae bacterium]|nr:Mth938-like domain-containing protein [Woeseiaceae bacterium]
MKFTRENTAAILVRSVSADGIRIGDEVYSRTIGVAADAVIDDWQPKDISDLVENDFAALLDFEPEVIVLGTGTTSIFPPRELVFAMARRQIGFEVMDTGAAARTYNVLAGEGRKVVALLYCPDAA